MPPCFAFLLLSLSVFASAEDSSHPVGGGFDQTIDKITARETENVKAFAKYSPIVETYVQGFRKDKELGRVPVEDQYFLGRASFTSRLKDDAFITQERPVVTHRLLREIKEATFERRKGWVPLGFAQMAVIDMRHFDHSHYKFVYHQREYLGTVRCLVFDVTPIVKGHGQFMGRISEILETVVNNLIVTNNLAIEPEVRCRVLLTAPMEKYLL